MEKAELLEEIDRLPKFEKLDIDVIRGNERLRQENLKAIVAKGENQAVAVLSKYYRLAQFSDVFKPIIEKLGKIEGQVYHYRGVGELELFPVGEDVGVCIQNSVDSTTALKVSFIYRSADKWTFIPRSVYGYRHIHRGDLLGDFNRFTFVLAEVKKAWKAIVDKMSKIQVTNEKLEELKKILRVGKRLEKVIEKIYEPNMDLWSFFLKYVKEISRRKFKSMIHQRQRLSRVSNVIIGYALFLKA